METTIILLAYLIFDVIRGQGSTIFCFENNNGSFPNVLVIQMLTVRKICIGNGFSNALVHTGPVGTELLAEVNDETRLRK